MDNFFPYAQFGGCVTFFVLSAMLVLSRTHNTKHKHIYRRSRFMLIMSQVILALQFLIQFNMGWRESDPEVAVLCNMILFPLTGMLMMWSLFFIFNMGEVSHKAIFWSMWIYLAITGMLLIAYWNRNILFPAECLAAIFYTMMFGVIGYNIYKDFQNVRRGMDNYFSQDTTSHTEWLGGTIMALVFVALFVPFAVLSNSIFLKFVTLANFCTIFFYVNRFIYYGYDIQMIIERHFEMAEADILPAEEPKKSHHGVENALNAWVEKKAFTEPEITIEDLVKQTGFRRSTLATYINNTLGMSFRSWLNSIRINEAKRIMTENPEYSHETIAELSGFSSRTYFLKVFKDKEGITPGDWLDKELKSSVKGESKAQ